MSNENRAMVTRALREGEVANAIDETEVYVEVELQYKEMSSVL